MTTLLADAPSHWVHDLSPFLVRFSESWGIRYYGLAYALAFVIAAVLLRVYWQHRRSPFNPPAQTGLMTAIIIGVLAGGRLGYFLLYSPQTLAHDPLDIVRIWKGGMASHGGFLGVCVALVWFVRKHHVSWGSSSDVLVTLAPPGLFLGRIANFINGELWGKVSTVPWAVIFPGSAPEGTPVTELPPRHPSQLYEAALEGLVLGVYTQWRFWRSKTVLEKPGHLAGEFLILYGILRPIGEAFREPDAPLLFGLSRGTFYSVFLILGGVLLLIQARYRAPKPSSTCSP